MSCAALRPVNAVASSSTRATAPPRVKIGIADCGEVIAEPRSTSTSVSAVSWSELPSKDRGDQLIDPIKRLVTADSGPFVRREGLGHVSGRGGETNGEVLAQVAHLLRDGRGPECRRRR